MLRYLAKRLALLLVTLWGITLICFVMLQFAPGSPIEQRLRTGPEGAMATDTQITEEIRERLRKQYNFDKPVLVRYYLWMKDVVVLDFGTSYHGSREPVMKMIWERLPISITLGLTGIALALFVGIPLGIIAAYYRGRAPDRVITLVTTGAFAMPSYLLGIILIVFLAGGSFLSIFPIGGTQSDEFESLSFFAQIFDRIHHFILPCFCYGIAGIAVISQQQRNSLLEALTQDYIRTARAKGLSEFKVVFKHAFRNSLIPILTMLGGMIPAVLGASIIIEYLFSIPGLGDLSFRALLDRDYPVIMANFTIGALLTLFGILASDIMYVFADPRISFEGGE